jgi:peptidoglycan hydrolase-like protein with peptidoglycan-binding domain
MLQACGYYVVQDGVCGPETGGALARFQSRNGLYPSGHANAYTTELLIRRCIQ